MRVAAVVPFGISMLVFTVDGQVYRYRPTENDWQFLSFGPCSPSANPTQEELQQERTQLHKLFYCRTKMIPTPLEGDNAQ